MVMVVEVIVATPQRGSVHAPSPPRYTNSTCPRLCHFAIGSPLLVVYPVAVCFTDTGSAPVARCARPPLTYTCRVVVPAGTRAGPMFLPGAVRGPPGGLTPPPIPR